MLPINKLTYAVDKESQVYMRKLGQICHTTGIKNVTQNV